MGRHPRAALPRPNTNILLALLNLEPSSGNTPGSVMRGRRVSGPKRSCRGALHAPELARVEATNMLRRLELAKQLTTAEANAAHEDLMQLDLELFSFEPFAERIWELRHTVTSYDAWYVAVAEALKLPLATLDRRLSRVNRRPLTARSSSRADRRGELPKANLPSPPAPKTPSRPPRRHRQPRRPARSTVPTA
jgi:predicted nucleic acid-binding protein